MSAWILIIAIWNTVEVQPVMFADEQSCTIAAQTARGIAPKATPRCVKVNVKN